MIQILENDASGFPAKCISVIGSAQSATSPDNRRKKTQGWVKMMPNRNAPAAFATTALMILRNRLSERVWGCHGVHTLPIADRSPACRASEDSQPALSAPWHGPRQFSPARLVRLSCILTCIRDLTEGIGVIGDSISDEYRFYAPDRATARNWVEILAASRGFYFGDPILASGGSTEDRRFAYNWSQSGATTTSLIARARSRDWRPRWLAGLPSAWP